MNFEGGSGEVIKWNPKGTRLSTTKGMRSDPTAILVHEMSHALDGNRGLMDDRMWKGLNRNECQAAFRENIFRLQFGIPLRTHYMHKTNSSGSKIGGTGPSMLYNGNVQLLHWYKR